MAGGLFSFRGGRMDNTGVVFTGMGHKVLDVGSGAVIAGTNGEKAFFKREDATGGTAEWSFTDYASKAADEETRHYIIEGTGNRYRSIGSIYEGGCLDAADGAFEGGYALYHANVESSVAGGILSCNNESSGQYSGNIAIRR